MGTAKGNPFDALHSAVGGATMKLLGVESPEASAPPDPEAATAEGIAKAARMNKRRRLAVAQKGFASTIKTGKEGLGAVGSKRRTMLSPIFQDMPPIDLPTATDAATTAASTKKTSSSSRDVFEARQTEGYKPSAREKYETLLTRTKKKTPQEMLRP